MINHTCLIPPTGVPVEEMTHCASDSDPPRGTCRVLPNGQVVELAYEDVVPKRAPETVNPVRVAIPTAGAAPVRRRRRLIMCEIRMSAGVHAPGRSAG